MRFLSILSLLFIIVFVRSFRTSSSSKRRKCKIDIINILKDIGDLCKIFLQNKTIYSDQKLLGSFCENSTFQKVEYRNLKQQKNFLAYLKQVKNILLDNIKVYFLPV